MQQDDASSSSYTARGTKSAQCRAVLWGGRGRRRSRERREHCREILQISVAVKRSGGGKERSPYYTWGPFTSDVYKNLGLFDPLPYQYYCLLLSQTPPPSVRTLYSNGPLDGGRAAVGRSLSLARSLFPSAESSG